MKSLAQQQAEELGGRWSVLAQQKRDHMKLDALLEAMLTSTGEAREELLNRIYRLVFSHAFAEEAVLWPALRRNLDDGEELTAQVEREHQEITELVGELERTAPDDPARPELIDRTVAMLRRDVRDEEDVLLPRLQEAVDARTLRRLGVSWALARRTAPTRTHPIVSRRPPGNHLSALPLGLTDRLRDGLDHAARRVPQAARPAVTGASRALGSLAHKVEHLPPLRRGERAETHVATGTGR